MNINIHLSYIKDLNMFSIEDLHQHYSDEDINKSIGLEYSSLFKDDKLLILEHDMKLFKLLKSNNTPITPITNISYNTTHKEIKQIILLNSNVEELKNLYVTDKISKEILDGPNFLAELVKRSKNQDQVLPLSDYETYHKFDTSTISTFTEFIQWYEKFFYTNKCINKNTIYICWSAAVSNSDKQTADSLYDRLKIIASPSATAMQGLPPSHILYLIDNLYKDTRGTFLERLSFNCLRHHIWSYLVYNVELSDYELFASAKLYLYVNNLGFDKEHLILYPRMFLYVTNVNNDAKEKMNAIIKLIKDNRVNYESFMSLIECAKLTNLNVDDIITRVTPYVYTHNYKK